MNPFEKALHDAALERERKRREYVPLTADQLEGLRDTLECVSSHGRATYPLTANANTEWHVTRTVQRPTERIAVRNIIRDAYAPAHMQRERNTDGVLHIYTPIVRIQRVHGLRPCARCGEWRERGEFYANSSRADKLDVYCKPCRKQVSATYRGVA